MSNVAHWDDFYKKPLDDIPWEISNPPQELKHLVESKAVNPGKALDIACGSGNYSLYLARNGFEVSGIDFSKRAIKIAEEKATKASLKINFVAGDVLSMDKFFGEKEFDFVLDYSLLHHIAPSDIEKYAAQIIRTIKPGGKLLLVCYSEKHKRAKGDDKAVGKYGNTMFFRSKEDILNIYKNLKLISYKTTRLGKNSKHSAHCFFFQKH